MRPGPKQISVTAMDLIVLLDHLFRGSVHPKVGHEHADKTFNQVVASLNRRVLIPLSAFEDAMWAVNMMHEAKEFRHPMGRTYENWVDKITRNKDFNVKYNWLEDKT